MPVELVAPAEESSSRLVPEAVPEPLRGTTVTDHGARCIIGGPGCRAELEAEDEDMVGVVVDEDEEEGPPFSKVPSAASVQRYRRDIVPEDDGTGGLKPLGSPRARAQHQLGGLGEEDLNRVVVLVRTMAPSAAPAASGLAGACQDDAVGEVPEELVDRPGQTRRMVAMLRYDLAEVSHADGEVVSLR